MSDRLTNNEQKRALLKSKKKEILLAYLADPGNEILPRYRLATEVLKYRQGAGMYRLFSPSELSEIEREALDLRRQRYAADLARVDRGLLDRAISGDPAAAKLCFMRYEGWIPGERRQVDLTSDVKIAVFKELLEEIADANRGFEDLGFEKAEEE